MVLKTDAIVLRTMKYRDTSQIATLYSRDLGRISVIVKGVREKAARFGGIPDVMGFLSVVVYWHEDRDLHLLSRWELKRKASHLTEDMERMAAGLGAIELIDAVSHHEEHRGAFFDLLSDLLDAADRVPRNMTSILPYFQLQVLSGLGFRPGLELCRRCGRDLTSGELEEGEVEFEPGRGTVSCAPCASHEQGNTRLSGGALRTMQRLLRLASPASAADLAMDIKTRNEVSSAIHTLLLTHVEGVRPLKSEAVFSALR